MFVLPAEWGGLNKRTVVWAIKGWDLSPDLVAQEDTQPGRRRHVSIGPSRTMLEVDFIAVIKATQVRWKKIVKLGP
jgi:hypothetical protein